MSLSGAGAQSNHVSGSSSLAARPLLVPAADILAKNKRAQEQHGRKEGLSSTTDPTSPTLFLGFSSISDSRKLSERQKNARFRRATPSGPNPLAALLSKLLSFSKRSTSTNTTQNTENTPSTAVKVATACKKVATISSRAPDPTIIALVETMLILIVKRFRPHWFDYLGVKVLTPLLLVVPLILAIFWRKAEFFKMIREEKSILTHPAEHRLDGLEAELNAREQRVRAAEETLKKDRLMLDDLKKELRKKGNIVNSDGIIVPSRRAAEMIVAGALGPGYDPATAHEVENRRRLENVQKCRQQWRQLAECSHQDVDKTRESLQLLAAHAARAYSDQTKALKIQTGNANSPSDKLAEFKKIISTVNPARGSEDSRRNTMQSDRSTGDSTDSRRRITFFRKKRRDTAPVLEAPRSVQDSARRSEVVSRRGQRRN